jgi:putative dimethyl sulfoxide reductase chaperone
VTKKEIATSTEVLGGFRVAFYLLLSRAFSREPNAAVLKNMEQISGTLMEVWSILQLPSDPDIEAGRDLLKAFFSGLNDDADKVVQGLAREYASLFLGVGPETIPPCESVYRSTSGLLYQSTLFEVQQSYRKIGMVKSDLYQEPDDHIAVELSYMARLCEMKYPAASDRESKAGQQRENSFGVSSGVSTCGATTQEGAGVQRGQALAFLKLQQDFLDGHLLQWVPLFSQRLIAAAPSGFYRAMAHLLKGYMGIDNGLIEEMIRELQTNPRPETERRQKKSKNYSSSKY